MKCALICPICQKNFFRYISKGTYQSRTRYCSNECRIKGSAVKGYKKTRSDKGKYRKRIDRKCLNCDKVMPVIPALINRKNFCRRSCFYEYRKTAMLGDKNPAWINGSSYDKRSYRGDDWEDIRKIIYKRDNWTCRVCKIKCISKKDATKKTYHKVIQCHHIKKYKETHDNSEDNLMTVCLGCHSKLH